MFQAKKILSDVVKQAYGTSENLEQYQKFYIEVSDKNMASKHGVYHGKHHKITIYNTYRDDEAVICTTLHELAHHIDYVNRKTSDHGKEFYAIFRVLLYAALDMGVVSKKKFLETAKDASDSNKIRKIMDDYVPNPVEYKTDSVVISVKNGYDRKEKLKEAGYSYNGHSHTWDIETTDLQVHKVFLKSISAEYEIRDAVKMAFTGHVKLAAGKGAYRHKEYLKADGFKWIPDSNCWTAEVRDMDEAGRMIKKYASLGVVISIQKK